MLPTSHLQGANNMAFWQNPGMSNHQRNKPSSANYSDLERELPDSGTAVETPGADLPDEPQATKPKEIGGRDGLEPTRYGDWEKAGRCIDF